VTQKVEHIITGLDIGGAELMLSNLARRGVRYRHSVTSLSSGGRIIGDLLAHGVGVTEMGMKRELKAWRSVNQLACQLKQQSPALVQTWLYHADLVGGLAARRTGVPVVWNLRQTDVGRGAQKWSTAVIVRLCALLSNSLPYRIVCGSHAARKAHCKMGFSERRMLVISNGVDTNLFKYDKASRQEVRSELGVTEDTFLIGRIGRYHPQKDYKGFIEAAGRMAGSSRNLCFLLAGENVDWDNQELVDWIEAKGLSSSFRLLGARRDVSRILSGLDLFVSSSIFGEGFPNVIAEAMACEVPSIATDVGDSAEIIGRPRHIVAAGDYASLASAATYIQHLPLATRRQLGRESRERVAKRYSMGAMIESYEDLYDKVTNEVAANRSDESKC
jgi:glycosyltransferase involved in cell wall biosynthesis